MLDSGTQHSVIDIGPLLNLGIPYNRARSKVHGLCSNPVKVCGKAVVDVDVGGGHVVRQLFAVLESSESIIILEKSS